MNDVIILMHTEQDYYETGQLSHWFNREQVVWWDEIFNIKYIDIRKKIKEIAQKTLERANPSKIYHYSNKQVIKEIVDEHHAWVILFDDDDFLSYKVVEFLKHCNDYRSLVHWNAVISYPFGNRWEANCHPYDFISEKTYHRQSICMDNDILFNGVYAIHTSNNLILPWEFSVLRNHMQTAHIKENRLFVPELDSVYTGIVSYSRLRYARNRQDLCNFISFFKSSYVEYPQEFKQEEVRINELMKSVELTDRGRKLGLRLSKASLNSVVSLL